MRRVSTREMPTRGTDDAGDDPAGGRPSRAGSGDARGGAAVDEETVAFAVASYLRRRGAAFADVAEAFERASRSVGAFPRRTDVFGVERDATFEELARGAFASVREDALERALSNARAGTSEDDDGRARRGGADGGVEGDDARVERARGRTAHRDVLKREVQGGRRSGARRKEETRELLETSMLTKNMNCLRTLRAHRDAAYCAVLSKSGRRLVTGGDDRLVKIWSTHNGLLQSACRGHVGEITYVAVDETEEIVASASTDTSIRTWNLWTGAPIAVLLGHTRSITELHFCPLVPHVLLSTADDGTVRLWSAVRSSNDVKPMVIDLNVDGDNITGGQILEHDVMPLAAMANDATSPGMRTRRAQLDAIAAESVGEQERPADGDCQVLCGAFNKTGDVFAVGTNTCKIFMWQLGLDEMLAVGDGSPPDGSVKKISVSGTHLNDVVSVYFAHHANLLLSASKEGQARIWAPSGHKPLSWVLRSTLTTPDDAAALRAQQRMDSITSQQYTRRGPTVPNMHIAVWSADDTNVIASMGDQSVRVWDAATGKLRHCMREHTSSTYVLQGNPRDPRLAMSASYDGKAVIWDIVKGSAIRVFDGSHCNTQLVDGNWHPDGTSIVVSDLAGQFSIFGTGDSVRLLRTKYEQFFQTEFISDDFLGRSEGGHLIDLATGALLNDAYRRNLLCDAMGDPYPDPYQSAFQSGQVAKCLPTADAGMMDVAVVPPSLAALAPEDVQGPWSAPDILAPAGAIMYRMSDDEDVSADEQDDEDDEDVEIDSDEEDEDEDYDSDAERLARRRERDRARRSRRQRRRFDSDESEFSESEDPATRRSTRQPRRPDRLGVDTYETSDEEEEGQPRITRRRKREMQELGIESEEEDAEEEEEEIERKKPKLEIKSRADIRLHEAYSWLCATSVTAGAYVPQLGDRVVYVAQGHYERMQENGVDWLSEAPWQTLTSMRFVEPCVVQSLRYVISDDGTYDTHCLIELKLIDPSCGNCGSDFLIELKKSDTADFLVPLSRYLTAESHAWNRGDLCAALWDDTGLGDMSPWFGIVNKKRENEGRWRGSPWNTLCVQYFNVQNEDDKFMDHSFWELYTDDAMRKEHAKALSEASTSRGPQPSRFFNIDENTALIGKKVRKQLVSRLKRVVRNERFEAFVNLIGPNESFARADGVRTNYCSVVPTPMSLDLILARLKGSYYRQVDAFKSDVELLRINSEIFHGEDSLFATCAAELEDDLLHELPEDEDEPLGVDGIKSYPTIASALQSIQGNLPNGGRLRVRMRQT